MGSVTGVHPGSNDITLVADVLTTSDKIHPQRDGVQILRLSPARERVGRRDRRRLQMQGSCVSSSKSPV
ncbi:hypothetical protein EVAR_5124_1 [Eumeta japonica]|uniref:Uncharacterized protein n=1 Tax=Eumeta variegata TaxID=151549 RepID=A0A4C1SVA4_EUMVA|nr:hypothetical protein EVAR_5124_1 [Eumeta japonica]